MKLSIGMACHEDFEGIWMTIQALRMYHDCRNVEFVVVDNSPGTMASRATQVLVEKKIGGQGKYVPLKTPVGTSPARNEIFKHASGDFVLALDCHVMLLPGVLDRLVYWLNQHPDCQDLLSGPMLYDDLAGLVTHFADEWRSEMWGTWQLDERGKDPHGPPFDVPGMGLGLFCCRRDAWLGFNDHARGFGGEEMVIHETFRRAGRRCLCLPFLRWLHRFGRSYPLRYPLTRWNKVRNYVLGFAELGMDPKPIYDHFIGGTPKLMGDYQWDFLLENPIEHVNPPLAKGPGTELKKMLQTLGINPSPSCTCNGKTNQLDILGPDGCEKKRAEIIKMMQDGEQEWGWRDKLQAAAKAVTTGLAFQLNPFDIWGSLIDEAIKRAKSGNRQPVAV